MTSKIKLVKAVYCLCLMLFGISNTVFSQEISGNLDDFIEVKTYNGVKVEVIPSQENRIEISGHSKEKVKYEVVDNRLEIKLSLENIWADDNTLIKVYAKTLEIVNANENSIVEITGELTAESPVFDAQEGAAIYAEVSARAVRIRAVTGGNVQIRGETEELEVNITTGGRFFGKNLQAVSAEVSISAGGLAEVYATEYCKATAKLGGNIHLYGNPRQIDRKTTLGGKILEKN